MPSLKTSLEARVEETGDTLEVIRPAHRVGRVGIPGSAPTLQSRGREGESGVRYS